MHSLQLTSRSGATSVMDNKILCRVLFVHRGKTQEFLPRKDLGIRGNDHFPRQGCRPGETPSIANGTLGKAQDLCPLDRQGESLPKILGIQRKPNLLRPIT
jgi:hypothetical protein